MKEQIIEDPISGLTIQLALMSEETGAPFRLRIFGNLLHGNREFLFDRDGVYAGSGTTLSRPRIPTWLRIIDH